jgi:NhaP-type Na+/H+ or K+/H+ antiporter
VLTGLLAWALTGLGWAQAFLLGAVLSPTDPVLAEAIVRREEVPYRLRRFLNVESGLNDGLALPFVIVFLGLASHEDIDVLTVVREIGLGVALGVVVPIVGIRAVKLRIFAVSERYQPLAAIAIALIVLASADLVGGNLFLAAFVSGVTLVTFDPGFASAFEPIGSVFSEVVKLGALLAFGALFSVSLIDQFTPMDLVFMVAALLLVRPVALLVSFAGRSIDWPLFAAAAWFGPKGFATVTFSLVVLQRAVPDGQLLFHLAGLVVTASIIAHSSTDVVVAQLLERRLDRAPQPADD